MRKRRETGLGMACLVLLAAACDSGSSGKLDDYYERALADVERTGAVELAAEPASEGQRRGLPAGFTVYPDAVVVSDDPIEAGSGVGKIISMTTRASPAEVARFYRRQADEAGISIDRSSNEQGIVTLTGSKPDGASFDLTAAPMGDGGTSANLMVLGTS